MKKISALILLLILTLNFNTLSYSIEADVFVQSTVNRAADTLGGNKTKEERIIELKEIALDTVDITGIGFYSLGKHRKNLKNAKNAQNKEILLRIIWILFKSLILRKYIINNPISPINPEIINHNVIDISDVSPPIKVSAIADWTKKRTIPL